MVSSLSLPYQERNDLELVRIVISTGFYSEQSLRQTLIAVLDWMGGARLGEVFDQNCGTSAALSCSQSEYRVGWQGGREGGRAGSNNWDNVCGLEN